MSCRHASHAGSWYTENESPFIIMSDKTKQHSAPAKVTKVKRPFTVSGPSSTRAKTTPPHAANEKQSRGVPKRNTTLIDCDTTILKQENLPNFDAESRQIAYGKFLRTMLEECLIDEKIERSETLTDLQMTQLAQRFNETMNQLDKTNRRLKDISFVVEQKRLLDLKTTDSSKFFNTTDDSDAQELLHNLNTTESVCLDNLETKNVDFGYNKESGHKQLLDAVNDCINGLDEIKKHSNLDMDKFKEYEKSQMNIQDLEKERFDLEMLKEDFEKKFPKFNEKLLKEVSDTIAKVIEEDTAGNLTDILSPSYTLPASETRVDAKRCPEQVVEEKMSDDSQEPFKKSLSIKIIGTLTLTRNELSRQLDLWLSKADLTHGPARAIIAPHAGYSYCGACAAFAYRQISPVVVKRIFILGPSHHVRLGGCALSSLDKYQTPLYDLTIDKQIDEIGLIRRISAAVYAELEATRQFEWMDTQTDEEEHSIEMHLPYIAKVMEEYKTGFTIIPILVGSLTPEKEAKYGAILAPYLADPQNLVVISSDFCHWGQRFRYTWRDSSRGDIHQSIEWLDKQGMNIIEKMDPRAFTDYLNKYGNTICGRHPIGVLLQSIARLQSQPDSPRMSLKFLKYAQSSQCMSMHDSSVSYASASLVFE
ncbi:unnamed protein product [Diatraea saccharalis]|uniref:Protein MEMO1 n=1 Tax=Diatraea saccharalis TaxID=40085 RepID=A0A9N9WG92_9NEOP|nr:unnamed protein product [Diatraea saccharalis]